MAPLLMDNHVHIGVKVNHRMSHLIIVISTTVLSLGVIGWLMYKLGVLEVLLTIVINFALLFPLMLVMIGFVDAANYNALVAEVELVWEKVNKAIDKGLEPKMALSKEDVS